MRAVLTSREGHHEVHNATFLLTPRRPLCLPLPVRDLEAPSLLGQTLETSPAERLPAREPWRRLVGGTRQGSWCSLLWVKLWVLLCHFNATVASSLIAVAVLVYFWASGPDGACGVVSVQGRRSPYCLGCSALLLSARR